jgi:4-amino-4-deoxy-L-arabinose transferase-like glycosyltransferase
MIGSKRFRIVLFSFFLAMYVLTFRGLSVGDNVYHYEFAKSILCRHQLALPESNQLLQTDRSFSPFFAIGRNGRPYSTLPPGLPIASLPLGSLGFLMESLSGDGPVLEGTVNTEIRFDVSAAIGEIRHSPSGLMTGLINPIISALLMVVFFGFSYRIGGDRPKAFVLTMLLGCCTIIWPYSGTYWTQPITAFCLFTSLYFLYRYKESLNQKYLVFSGLLAGFAILTRYETLLFVLLFLVYAVFGPKQKKSGRFKAGILFISIAGIALILIMAWNYHRFGSVLDTGAAHQHNLGFSLKGNLTESLPSNLIGLNRSIFIYSPPLLLGLLGFAALFKTNKVLAWVITLLIVTGILLYSKFSFWATWCSWGSRFTVILTPFLLLPAALRSINKIWKGRLLLMLAIAGIAIQLTAVLIPFQQSQINAYYRPGRAGDHLFKSDIVPQFKALFSANSDYWWTSDLLSTAFGVLLIITLIASGWYLAKTYVASIRSVEDV